MNDHPLSNTDELLAENIGKLTELLAQNANLLEKISLEHRMEIRKIALTEWRRYYSTLNSQRVDFAQRYSTVVLFGSYAAFFAIWANIEKHIASAELYDISAVIVGLSVFVFCMHEIYQMVLMTKYNAESSVGVTLMEECSSKGNYSKMFDALHEAEHKNACRVALAIKYWKPALYTSIGLGVAGVAVFLRAISLNISWKAVISYLF